MSAVKVSNSKYEGLSLNFHKPKKNDNGIYLANLETPIKVELPELDIYSVGNKMLNGVKEYQIWYLLDLNNKKHKELLELLYFLEEKAIEASYQNSKNWFGNKQLSKNTLENLFVQSYDSDDEDNIILKLIIKNKSLLPLFEYRHFSTIEFTDIRFFKKNFGYTAVVTNVNKIEDIGSENESQEDSSEKANINLLEYLNNKDKLEVSSSNVITDDVVDNLAEDTTDDLHVNKIEPESDNHISREDTNSISTKVTELSKIELKSVVSNKRQLVERYFKNAERANRAAENLRLKAIRAHNDLKKYEELYSNFTNGSDSD